MTSSNDITGDYLVNKKTNDAYRSNYDAIFRKAKQPEIVLTQEQQAAMDEMADIFNKDYTEKE